MSSIYYPFFYVERFNNEHYQHKNFLILLSLFSKDILIPIRHLFYIGEDEFEILLNFKELINNGTLYYRLPNNIKNLNDYLTSIKSTITDIPQKTIDYRVLKLNDAVKTSNVEKHYDPLNQQIYFSQRLKNFLRNYLESHKKISKIARQQINDILQEDTLSKETFDSLLNNAFVNKKISKQIYFNLRNASIALYLCAGTSNDKLKVCKTDILDISNIDACIINTIHNYNEIICDNYNPMLIVKTLEEIELIESTEDFCKLSCNDVVELRSSKWHKKFVAKYCKLSTTQRALRYLNNKKKVLSNIKTIKTLTISLMLTIITTVISYFLAQAIIPSIITSIITFIITEAIGIAVQKHNYKIKFLDSFTDMILGLFVPDVLYLYKIYEKLNNS